MQLNIVGVIGKKEWGLLRKLVLALYVLSSILSIEILSLELGFRLFLNKHRVSYPYAIDVSMGFTILMAICLAIAILEIVGNSFRLVRSLWLALASLISVFIAKFFLPHALIFNAFAPMMYMMLRRDVDIVGTLMPTIFAISVAQYLPVVGDYLGGPAWCGLEIVSAICIPIALASWLVSVPSITRMRVDVSERSEALDAYKILVVILTIAFGTILYALPYTKYLNPHAKPVSVDIRYYLRWLREVEVNGPQIMFERFDFGLDRPIFLSMIYAVSRVVNDYLAVTAITILSHALLLFSVWLLTYWLYDYETAIMATILASVSSQTLAFMYAGFNANHLSLALLYLSYAFMVRRRYLASVLLQLLAAFTHAWSWLHVATALALCAFARLVRGDRKALIALMGVGLTFVVRQVVGGGVTNVLRIAPPLAARAQGAKLSSAWSAWSALHAIATYYLWGTLNSPVLYITAALDRAERFDDLTYLYIVTFAAFILSISDPFIALRILLDVPFYISSAALVSKHVRSRLLRMLFVLSFVPSYIYFLLNVIPKN